MGYAPVSMLKARNVACALALGVALVAAGCGLGRDGAGTTDGSHVAASLPAELAKLDYTVENLTIEVKVVDNDDGSSQTIPLNITFLDNGTNTFEGTLAKPLPEGNYTFTLTFKFNGVIVGTGPPFDVPVVADETNTFPAPVTADTDYDDDEDGCTNFVELDNGSDPKDATSKPAGSPVPPEGLGLGDPNVRAALIVSAQDGDDANDGVCFPLKTISIALQKAVAGDFVWVAPGRYDTALGEVFPIVIPGQVHLVGDVANRGDGSEATIIPNAGGESDLVRPETESVIEGFLLANGTNNFPCITIAESVDNVVIRSNNFSNPASVGLYVSNGSDGNLVTDNVFTGDFFGGGRGIHVEDSVDGSVGHAITDNTFRGNATGLFFGNGTSALVAGNTIIQNSYGIQTTTAGLDLGGGALDSPGGNTLSCNTQIDLFTSIQGGVPPTLWAANNFWDHSPPNSGTVLGGTDIYIDNIELSVIVSGSSVASVNCE